MRWAGEARPTRLTSVFNAYPAETEHVTMYVHHRLSGTSTAVGVSVFSFWRSTDIHRKGRLPRICRSRFGALASASSVMGLTHATCPSIALLKCDSFASPPWARPHKEASVSPASAESSQASKAPKQIGSRPPKVQPWARLRLNFGHAHALVEQGQGRIKSWARVVQA